MICFMDRNDIYADFKRGLSNSEIARNHNCSRNTVIKFRKQYEEAMKQENASQVEDFLRAKPKYKTPVKPKRVLTKQVVDIIEAAMHENAVKRATGMRKQCKMGKDIYQELIDKGYDVSYRSITRYIFEKTKSKDASVKECFIKQGYTPGAQMEFDWGEVTLEIAGQVAKYNLAAVALSSNGRWGALYPRQDKQAMMEAHVDCFDYWGHVPQNMVYDNMRTAVKSFTGRQKTPTAELMMLEAFYGFKHRFCNVCSGNEKGHVERAVEILRRRAFAQRMSFDSLDSANIHLQKIFERDNALIADAIKEDLSYMLPATARMDCYEADYRHVGKLSTFCLDTNNYSVPCQYVDKDVWVKKSSRKVLVYDTEYDGKKLIAEHSRNYGTEQWQMELSHYLKVLLAKPGALRQSVAFRQTPEALQALYEKHFSGDTKSFIEMLMWADGKHKYDEICSAAHIAELKGVKTITKDVIKGIIEGNTSGVMDAGQSESIEKYSVENLMILGQMFNSNMPS